MSDIAMEQSRLLTINQGASQLGVSRAHLYRIVSRGELRTVKLGRNRRIAMEDLREFIDRLRQAAREEAAEA